MTDIEEHAIQAGARAILDHWRYIEKFSRSDAPLPDGPAWDLARAAIAAYEAAMWQTMDTAPRDGTAFLARIGEKFAVIYWSGEAWDFSVGFAMFDDMDDEPPSPTLWRPLPEHPKVKP